MLAFVSLLKKRAKNYILNDREFIKKERVASRIVSNPEIKKILCPRLRTDVESDTFEVGVRARLVEVVTSLLTEDRIAKEFAIARDPRMFSLIVLKILQLGIINYCKENVVEESLD
jgi:hypothetical protein